MRPARKIELWPFATVVALLIACFLMGGASRNDATSLVVLQPLAALCAFALLVMPGRRDWHVVAMPLLFLAGLAIVMVVQLIPLPPQVWAALPGRAPFAQTADMVGLSDVWRPISMTPDLTLASLIGLGVPAAVLVGCACIDGRQRAALLTVLLGGTLVSALLGLAQISGGVGSPFYTYAVTNPGSAVGLFANRNHQAVLIAMALAMLATWATMPRSQGQRREFSHWIAAGAGLFLLPLLLVTGSRAGLVLGVVGICGGWLLQRRDRHGGEAVATGRAKVIRWGAVLLAAALLIATVFLSRAEAIQRLLNLDTADDPRVAATPISLAMAGDFFPIGAGFGSFDPVFRFYEPAELISPKYLNHAHNDVLELIITAGLPGTVIAVLFLVWAGRQAFRAWRSRDGGTVNAQARLASLMLGIVLLSSLVDYPMRTPLMMAVIAIACAWLGDARDLKRSSSAGSSSKELYHEGESN